MHQLGHPLLKFSHQLQKSNAIRYTINFLHSCLEDDYVNVIKGASNGNELLLFFEQAVETSRPDSSALLERGDTCITVHSVVEERGMLAEYEINTLFKPPYFTHLNTCELCFHQMKAFSTEVTYRSHVAGLFSCILINYFLWTFLAVEVTVVGTISANVRVGDELSTCEPALSGVPRFGAPAVSFVY